MSDLHGAAKDLPGSTPSPSSDVGAHSLELLFLKLSEMQEESRLVGNSIREEMRQLGARMDDLEDSDRFSRRAGRYRVSTPQLYEDMRTSISSINAGSRDVQPIPFFSQ